MNIDSVCYVSDPVPPWWHVHVYHLSDMTTSDVPPFSLFFWTGFVFIAGGETLTWITNHHLDIKFRTLVPPTPPPKPTIELPIFDRRYRSHFGIVQPPYGPIDIDPCP